MCTLVRVALYIFLTCSLGKLLLVNLIVRFFDGKRLLLISAWTLSELFHANHTGIPSFFNHIFDGLTNLVGPIPGEKILGSNTIGPLVEISGNVPIGPLTTERGGAPFRGKGWGIFPTGFLALAGKIGGGKKWGVSFSRRVEGFFPFQQGGAPAGFPTKRNPGGF